MRTAVDTDRARMIIQGWYNEFCKEYGKASVILDIEEEHNGHLRAYKVRNNINGASTSISLSTLSDYEASGSLGIPGDLKTIIWDSLQDFD